MKTLRVNQTIIREFCEIHMSTHSDWAGTRVETKHQCASVDEFVKMLMTHIEDNQL
jgi:hypothetical protein